MQAALVPEIGEKMPNGGIVIALHQTAERQDQNDYVVLALLIQPQSVSMPYQYAVWNLYSNPENYITQNGDYFWGENAVLRAATCFANRAGLNTEVDSVH